MEMKKIRNGSQKSSYSIGRHVCPVYRSVCRSVYRSVYRSSFFVSRRYELRCGNQCASPTARPSPMSTDIPNVTTSLTTIRTVSCQWTPHVCFAPLSWSAVKIDVGSDCGVPVWGRIMKSPLAHFQLRRPIRVCMRNVLTFAERHESRYGATQRNDSLTERNLSALKLSSKWNTLYNTVTIDLP